MSDKHNNECLKKAQDGEPIFAVIGRDPQASKTILEWIKLSWDTQPKEKLQEAFTLALDMREHPKKLEQAQKHQTFIPFIEK